MSIVPPDPDRKLDPRQPSVIGVAHMMERSGNPVTREVGALVAYIGAHHEDPVTCGECRDGEFLPCMLMDNATSIVIAWLLELVDERG